MMHRFPRHEITRDLAYLDAIRHQLHMPFLGMRTAGRQTMIEQGFLAAMAAHPALADTFAMIMSHMALW